MKMIKVIEGLEMTDIALGAGKRGDPAVTQEAFRIMDKYLELGGNCFDTARLYEGGRSDIVLGEFLKSRGNRKDVVLCTKGNHPDPATMFVSRLSKEEIEGDLHESLAAIGTDYTDMHLLHRDNVKLPVGPIVEALSGLVTSGKARAYGVSNWSVTRIAEAIAFAKDNGLVAPSLCQLHYSLLETTAPATGDITHVPMNGIEFGWYLENQFPVMAFGSQGRGYFARVAAGEPQKEGGVRYYGWLPQNEGRTARLINMAKEMGVSIAALATAYVRDSGLKASALCAFSSVAQLVDSMGADAFTLTPAQIAQLEGK